MERPLFFLGRNEISYGFDLPVRNMGDHMSVHGIVEVLDSERVERTRRKQWLKTRRFVKPVTLTAIVTTHQMDF